MPAYLLLRSTSLDPCYEDQSQEDVADDEHICSDCGIAHPGISPREIVLQAAPTSPLNFIWGTGLGIAHKDLLASIGESAVRQALTLGPLYGPSKRFYENYVWFQGVHPIIVRGDRNAGYRVCTLCRKVHYFAMGKPYLFPHPPTDASILDAGNGALVVAESLINREQLARWKKLVVEPISVVDPPRDGFLELRSAIADTAH